jgi:hypothetical protein
VNRPEESGWLVTIFDHPRVRFGFGPTASAFRVSQFHFIDGNRGDILRVVKSEGQFNIVEMPSVYKLDGMINHLEIVGLCWICGPLVWSLKIKPC